MENAAQALKMGAAILVFSIALATTFMVFAQAVQVSEAVFRTTDNDSYMEYTEGDQNATKRIVGIDTVIASLYNYDNQDDYFVYIEHAGEIESFEISNEVIGSTAEVKQRIDKFVKEKLLNTSLRNAKFEESYKEIVYSGGKYTDNITGETIEKDESTKTRVEITYKVI